MERSKVLKEISKVFILLLVLGLDQGLNHAPALAATSQQRIKEAIQKSDVLSPQFRNYVNVVVNAELATVSVVRNPKAKPNDCKIDAVLMAQKIMAVDSEIKLVKICFFDVGKVSDSWQIEVSAAHVKAFATGAVGQSELLKSISLTSSRQQNIFPGVYKSVPYQNVMEVVGIARGPYEEERSALLLRLKNLQKQGLDMSAFTPYWTYVDNAIKTDQTDGLPEYIEKVQNSITEYVNAYNRNAAKSQLRAAAAPRPSAKEAATEASWQTLAQKYPDLVPTKIGLYIQSRQAVGYRLMQLAESGSDIGRWREEFKRIDDLAMKGDEHLLKQRLSAVQSALGLDSLLR